MGSGLFIRGRCHSRLLDRSVRRRIDAQPAFGVGLSALVGFGQSRGVLLVETPASAGAKQSARPSASIARNVLDIQLLNRFYHRRQQVVVTQIQITFVVWLDNHAAVCEAVPLKCAGNVLSQQSQLNSQALVINPTVGHWIQIIDKGQSCRYLGYVCLQPARLTLPNSRY